MIGLIIAADVIGFSYLYILLSKLIKRSKLYRELMRMIDQVSRIPDKISSKADLRRARKYQPYAKALRRKTAVYLIFNLGGFILAYAMIVFTTTTLVHSLPSPWVESPIVVPVYGGYDAERGVAYIHAYMLVLIAFALVIYPISKEIKLERPRAKI